MNARFDGPTWDTVVVIAWVLFLIAAVVMIVLSAMTGLSPSSGEGSYPQGPPVGGG